LKSIAVFSVSLDSPPGTARRNKDAALTTSPRFIRAAPGEIVRGLHDRLWELEESNFLVRAVF
jgi:hypothetical protein